MKFGFNQWVYRGCKIRETKNIPEGIGCHETLDKLQATHRIQHNSNTTVSIIKQKVYGTMQRVDPSRIRFGGRSVLWLVGLVVGRSYGRSIGRSVLWSVGRWLNSSVGISVRSPVGILSKYLGEIAPQAVALTGVH